MNYKLVFRLLGRLLLMEAALMVPSLAVALIFREGDVMAFVYTILLTAACGAAPSLLLHPDREDLTAKDGMAVLPGVVSRKKQVIPAMMNTLAKLETEE